jgi:hypothetical protein
MNELYLDKLYRYKCLHVHVAVVVSRTVLLSLGCEKLHPKKILTIKLLENARLLAHLSQKNSHH